MAHDHSSMGLGQHHHHDEASTEKLGSVHFPISCTAAQQAPFERGIALLHSFAYTEAFLQFTAISKADPTCAIARWGIAMTDYRELWGRPSADDIKVGLAQMQQAEALAARSHTITPRERAYIDALHGFFSTAGTDFQTAADGYAACMKTVATTYPQDIEAQAFYALSLIASVAPTDTSLTKERTALAILNPLFLAHPDHPGLAHYIIHTCDTPQLAQDGLAAAKVYAKIAPSSAHALHMPGHIFARLGMWPEDIESNLASVRASEQAIAHHEPGGAHQMHAKEFLVYAYLQVGEDAKARALTDSMASIGQQMAAMPGMDDMKDDGPFFTNELLAIDPMEMHDWHALAAIQPMAGSPQRETFDITWGHGVAAGHLHDAALADAAVADYERIQAAVASSGDSYLVNFTTVQEDELRGWQAYTHGQDDAAVAAMRRAAAQQDKLGQGEVDIPADEMLGDLLMLLHRPTDALAAYTVSLQLSPNRLNTLLAAGEAEEALGDMTAAKHFYAIAAANTHNAATSQRPDLLHAVALTQHTTLATNGANRP
jgi:tetratricopeptide (TPR) repeat protein